MSTDILETIAASNAERAMGLTFGQVTSLTASQYVTVALVMTVNPGFGGQKMIMAAVEKVREIDEMKRRAGLSFEIEVDGGVNEQTAPLLSERGATVLVASSALYGAPDAKAFVQRVKG